MQQSLVSATLKSHAVSSTSGDTSAYSSTLSISPALVQYAYGAPTFYLPEPSGYPRFFLADVTRATAVKSARPGGTDATTLVGGARGARRRPGADGLRAVSRRRALAAR